MNYDVEGEDNDSEEDRPETNNENASIEAGLAKGIRESWWVFEAKRTFEDTLCFKNVEADRFEKLNLDDLWVWRDYAIGKDAQDDHL